MCPRAAEENTLNGGGARGPLGNQRLTPAQVGTLAWWAHLPGGPAGLAIASDVWLYFNFT